MNKSLLPLFTVVALATSLLPGSATTGQEQNQGQEPVNRPRVVGQPQSFQERESWTRVEAETNLEKRSQEAERHLREFPEGGYAPFAHEVLALYFQQSNQMERYFEHAEKALQDLPEEGLLLAGLSSAYAEMQKPEEAIERGERALKVLPTQEAPLQLSPEQWAQQREKVISDASYGVGTGYLFKAYTSGGSPQLLALAVQHLGRTVELNPEHDRAHFRLGFAYEIQNDLEKAVLCYARAVALEGANASMARQYLSKSYELVHKKTSGMDRLVSQQKQYLKEQMKDREAQNPDR